MSGTNGHKPDDSMLKRVVAGATVGTALEWYDFFIYGTAAALVFGDLFFSDAVPGAGRWSRSRRSASASSPGRSAGSCSATSATRSGVARR